MIHLIRQPFRPPVRQFRHQFDFAERQIERLADFPHRRSQPVGRKRANQSHMLGAVACVHAQDQLFTDLAREIEVDVRHRGECLVQKAAEKELVGDRIDVRQAEQIADDRRNG